ncbi:hypothetical protein LEMLEM_LOCUS20720, partial [Lemmus lemmus]
PRLDKCSTLSHTPAPHWGIQASALPLSHTPAPHWGILGRGSTTEPHPSPSLGDSRQVLY